MKPKEQADVSAAIETDLPPWRDVMSTICHDLRDPLASVVMGTRFLRRALPADESADATKRVVEAMARSADRMNLLLSDLGDLTKLERHELKLRKATHDVTAFARAAHEEIASRAHTHSIETTFDVAPTAEGTSFNCDGERIKQIVLLLGAAALHVAPEKGSIAIHVDGDAQGGLRFRIATAASGSTTDRERAPMALPKLGVALAKGLIELHGGALRANRNGPAVTFEFGIPRA